MGGSRKRGMNTPEQPTAAMARVTPTKPYAEDDRVVPTVLWGRVDAVEQDHQATQATDHQATQATDHQATQATAELYADELEQAQRRQTAELLTIFQMYEQELAEIHDRYQHTIPAPLDPEQRGQLRADTGINPRLQQLQEQLRGPHCRQRVSKHIGSELSKDNAAAWLDSRRKMASDLDELNQIEGWLQNRLSSGFPRKYQHSSASPVDDTRLADVFHRLRETEGPELAEEQQMQQPTTPTKVESWLQSRHTTSRRTVHTPSRLPVHTAVAGAAS